MPSDSVSHVVPNIMLHPERWQRDILETRFHMAKQAFNRVRDEWLKRRRKYFQSAGYREAKALEDGKKRKEKFGRAMEAVGFTQPTNEQISAEDKNKLFGKPAGDGWCSDMAYHLPAEVLRRIGGMAVQAVWMYHTETDWGKPRPKIDPPPLVAALSSVSLKADKGIVRIAGPRGGASALKIEVNPDYLDDPKIQQSLSDKSANPKTMVCREIIGGQPEYKAKITCKGHAPLSPNTIVKEGVVGVDVGPSNVAIVGEEDAWIGPILSREFIDEYAKELRRIARQLDRQRRANNPEKFDDKGRVVGSGPWNVSNRQAQTYLQNHEVYRKLVEERKRQHYELAKNILSFGNKIIVEDNTYAGWQAGLFGSQIGDFAPSEFIARLEEKAKAAGGWLRRVSTWDTRLSSRCHCGRGVKKGLSDRWHECECGVSCQRDLYSAFLARYCKDGDLAEDQARKDWSKLEPALQAAASDNLNCEL